MRTTMAILLCASALTVTGCKKSGGGGGGGWLVGAEGLMANIDASGTPGDGYDLGASETLHEIACRYQGEAWVVGAGATLLYTNDGGQAWEAQRLPTTADLYALATQDGGSVFIGGDGVLFTSVPDAATGVAAWTQIGDGAAKFRAIAAAQLGPTVLAISDDGGLWSYENEALVKRTTIAGARAVAVSPDGQAAIVAGAGLHRSLDGGHTWSALHTAEAFEDVSIDDRGEGVAVGAAGAIARVDFEGRVLLQWVGSTTLRTLHLATWAADGALGYAAGDDGQVWITNDAGWSWTAGPNLGRTVLGVDIVGAGHN